MTLLIIYIGIALLVTEVFMWWLKKNE